MSPKGVFRQTAVSRHIVNATGNEKRTETTSSLTFCVLQQETNNLIQSTTIRNFINKNCLRMLYFEKHLNFFQIWHYSGVPKIQINR